MCADSNAYAESRAAQPQLLNPCHGGTLTYTYSVSYTQTIVNGLGHRMTHTYDVDNRVSVQCLPNGGRYTCIFGDNDPIVSSTNGRDLIYSLPAPAQLLHGAFASAGIMAEVLKQHLQRTLRPQFDVGSRSLYFGPYLVKKLKACADDQILIFTTFQEEDWKEIDDPLPWRRGGDGGKRLKSVIEKLNLNHRLSLIHFISARDGTGIAWELRA